MEPMRLQKYLARCGVASRRACESLIAAGRIKVNGDVVTEQGVKVNPDSDIVTFDDAPVLLPKENVTFMLNKPTGVISSMGDPFDRETVQSYLPLAEHPSLFPIGRLDEDTTGLLLFTTDGILGNALLHPKNEVEKTYRVTVEGKITPEHRFQFERGVQLDDGTTAPARVDNVEHYRTTSVLDLTIHEGKKREVRRMCEALGIPVIALHRHTFAGLELGTLQLGHTRQLTEKEVAQLRRVAHLENEQA